MPCSTSKGYTNPKRKKKEKRKPALSIPSISLALFVPLGGGGGATELLSSLPLAEEPGASEPKPRFLVEVREGLPDAARRCASMSFLRLAASSLFSSVSLRMRSCETQSSQLCERVSFGGVAKSLLLLVLPLNPFPFPPYRHIEQTQNVEQRDELPPRVISPSSPLPPNAQSSLHRQHTHKQPSRGGKSSP